MVERSRYAAGVSSDEEMLTGKGLGAEPRFSQNGVAGCPATWWLGV